MLNGTVKWFNNTKGFGFIQPDEGNGDVFVHHTCVEGEGFKVLNQGQEVEYEAEDGSKGLHAVLVRAK